MIRSLFFLLLLALGFLVGWSAERCHRVGWIECAKWQVSEIAWSRR
jgi:hypothetical protein